MADFTTGRRVRMLPGSDYSITPADTLGTVKHDPACEADGMVCVLWDNDPLPTAELPVDLEPTGE